MLNVHHIGYLVKNLDKARKQFSVLGFLAKGDITFDPQRGIDVLFMEKDGCTVELVQPISDGSVVADLMKRRKNSPYHICYSSDAFERDVSDLEKQGFIRMDEPAPAPAIDGRRVCFLMSAQIGMIELAEG